MPHHAFSHFPPPRERFLPACVRVAAVALLLTGRALAAPSLEVEMPEGVPVGTTAVMWGLKPGNRPVPAGLTDLKEIAVGTGHAVGLREDRTVVVWGYDTSPTVAVPPGLTDIAAVAAGADHSLVLKADGTVIAWGDDFFSQSTVPPGLTDVAAISASGDNSMALLRNGTVVSWGSVTNPMPANLTDVAGIAAGSRQSVAWKADGSIVLWGTGITGLPASVSGITALSVGVNHALALRADGSVGSWGLTVIPGRVPMPAGLSGVIRIATGSSHAVALKSNGTVVAWGENGLNQTVVPPGLRKVKAIAAGSSRTAALVPVLDFGAAPLLAAEPARTFTVKNPGADPLTITGVSMTGHGAAGFIVNTTGMASVVGPGGETHFSVTLRPVTGGPVDAAVQMQCDDPENAVFDIHVTGTGYGPEIEVLQNPNADLGPTSPDLSFGDVDVTEARKILPFTITNKGTETLLLPVGAMVEISGSEAADFSVTHPPDASVAAGGYTTFEITFDPSAAGLRSATVSVFSNDYDENPYTFGITGTGTLAPRIVVESPDDPSAGRVVLAWGSDEAGQRTPPADTSGIVAVSAGEYHTLALRADGTVAAWGGNAEGQTDVPAGLSGVSAISAGRRHSAALKGDGTVAVWGANDRGQSTVPAGLSGVIAVSAGGSHTVALKADGTVVAWGSNDYGQLTAPPGLIATAIAAGGNHTVVLTATGRVLAWGLNSSNQLDIPAGLADVVRISAGETSSSAVRSNGRAVSWGYGAVSPYTWDFTKALESGGAHVVVLQADGTLSFTGSNAQKQTTAPAGLVGVSAVAAGGTHTVALPLTGDYGAVAPGVPAGKTYTIRNTGSSDLTVSSVTLSGDAGVFSVDTTGMLTVIPPAGSTTFTGRFLSPSGGLFQSVVRVASSDTAHASYDIYQIARGTGPEIVLTGGGVDIPSGTAAPSLANLTDFGTVNLSASIGREFTITNTGTATLSLTGAAPVTITGPDAAAFSVTEPPPADLAARGQARFRIAFHPSAARLHGATVSLTSNDADENPLTFTIQGTGSGGPVLEIELPGSPARGGALAERGLLPPYAAPSGLSELASIAAGDRLSVALSRNGTVTAWGENFYGETAVPEGLTDVTAIAAGCCHALALRSDGSVVAWGYNIHGQATVPPGLDRVTSLSASLDQSVAVRADGTVVIWGETSGRPARVPYGLSGVISAAAGKTHTVALQSDGRVVAWDMFSALPLPVPAGLSGVIAVAAGDGFSVALRTDGTVAAWGQKTANGRTNVPAGLTDVVAISAGDAHTVALQRDGHVVAWGSVQQNPLAGWSGVTAISTGGLGHTLALVDALNFSTPVGQPQSSPLILRNTGTEPLTIQRLVLSGSDAARFQLDTTGMAASVPPGGSTTAGVTFLSQTGGGFGAAVQVQSNDAVHSDFQLQLRATATGPEIGVLGDGIEIARGDTEPSLTDSTDFGTIGLNQSAMREFTVVNTGTLPLHLSPPESVVISGEHATDFTVSRQPARAVGTGKGYSRFQVTFRPGAAGLRQAVVSVLSDDYDEGSFSFAVQGTGSADPVVEIGYTADGSPELLLWTAASAIPTYELRDLPDIVSFKTGSNHGLVLRANGTVVSWGTGSDGQSTVPEGLANVVDLSVGTGHSLALKSDGTVVAWGNNSVGQCNVPAGLHDAIAIAAGRGYSLALKEGGTVVAWGQTALPSALPGVAMITAGAEHSLALQLDGTIVSWGLNSHDQCNLPADLNGVTAVAAGFYQTLALRADGTLVAAGADDSRRFRMPPGLTDVVAISADTNRNMALKSDGTVVVWSSSKSPDSVPAGLRDVIGIDAGALHYSALRKRTFSSRYTGTNSQPKIFTITNSGASPLAITSVALQGAGTGFIVDTAGMATSLAPGGSTSVAVTFSPTSPGPYAQTLAIQSNAGPFALPVTGYAQDYSPAETAYRAWAANAGLTGEDALPLATPQGDGVANLLKFGFNMDPSRPDATILTPGTGDHGLPAISIGGSPGARTLRIEYVRRRYSSPVYTPRVGTSLDAMEPVTAVPVVTILDTAWERVVVSHPLGTPGPERIFGLVSVSFPE